MDQRSSRCQWCPPPVAWHNHSTKFIQNKLKCYEYDIEERLWLDSIAMIQEHKRICLKENKSFFSLMNFSFLFQFHIIHPIPYHSSNSTWFIQILYDALNSIWFIWLIYSIPWPTNTWYSMNRVYGCVTCSYNIIICYIKIQAHFQDFLCRLRYVSYSCCWGQNSKWYKPSHHNIITKIPKCVSLIVVIFFVLSSLFNTTLNFTRKTIVIFNSLL